MANNVSVEKSFEFSVRIVKLYQYLTKNQKEFVLAKQLLRCGTSIGANVSEAQFGQTKADFLAKMHIALKEANETEYWLRLLHRTEYLSDQQFQSIYRDVDELIRILAAICKNSLSSSSL